MPPWPGKKPTAASCAQLCPELAGVREPDQTAPERLNEHPKNQLPAGIFNAPPLRTYLGFIFKRCNNKLPTVTPFLLFPGKLEVNTIFTATKSLLRGRQKLFKEPEIAHRKPYFVFCISDSSTAVIFFPAESLSNRQKPEVLF